MTGKMLRIGHRRRISPERLEEIRRAANVGRSQKGTGSQRHNQRGFTAAA